MNLTLWIVLTAALTSLLSWWISLGENARTKALLYLLLAIASGGSMYWENLALDDRARADQVALEGNLETQKNETQRLQAVVQNLEEAKAQLEATNQNLSTTQTNIAKNIEVTGKQIEALKQNSAENFELIKNRLDLAILSMTKSTINLTSLVSGVMFPQLAERFPIDPTIPASQDKYIQAVGDVSQTIYDLREVLDRNDHDINQSLLSGISYMARFNNYKEPEAKAKATEYLNEALRLSQLKWFGRNDKHIGFLKDSLANS